MKFTSMAFTVALAFIGAGAAFLASQEDPTKQLMKAKAGYAHRLLDAVVEEEFETIRDQAFRLKAVAETADWNVIETPEYVRASESFIQATERLQEAARQKNGDAAALAYMDVTLHCHRYLKTRTSVPD